MRKFTLPIFIGFALLTLTTLTSCNIVNDYILNHEHTFTEYYVADDETHWKECTFPFCNAKEEYQYHYSTTSSCTLKPYCEICGEVYGEPNTHDFSIPIIEDKYFTGEINEEGVPLFNYVCHCGAVDTEGKPYYGHYVYYKEAVSPTCIENGTEGHYACYHCPNKAYLDSKGENFKYKSDIIIPQTGHYWVEKGSYDYEAHYDVCSNCGEKGNIEEHDYSNINVELSKNLTYGETYTTNDIHLSVNCGCGYFDYIYDIKNIYIESHVLTLGENTFEVGYKGVYKTITYNPNVASNNHDDWVNSYDGNNLRLEGIITAVELRNTDSYADFTILDKDGYGYYVLNTMVIDSEISVGDYVSVIGYKTNNWDIGEVLELKSYSILDNRTGESLEQSDFIDVTTDFYNLSTYEFNNKYKFVPIKITGIKLDYTDWGNSRISSSNCNLSYSSNFINNHEQEIYYRTGITQIDTTLYGLCFKENYIYAVSNVYPFEYSYVSDENKYYVDNSIIEYKLYNTYSFVENNQYELPSGLFSQPTYSLNDSYINAYLNGNTLVIGSLDYSSSFQLMVNYTYNGTTYYNYFSPSCYTKEEYDFNSFDIYDRFYDYETYYPNKYDNRESFYDRYILEVISSVSSAHTWCEPTVTFDDEYTYVKPVYSNTVTNTIRLTLYYGYEEYYREFKIVTLNSGHIMEYNNLDLMSIATSYGGVAYTDVGNNYYKGLKVTTYNCYTSSDRITICPGGYVLFTGIYDDIRYLELNIETKNMTYYYEQQCAPYYEYHICDTNGSYNYNNYISNSEPHRYYQIVNNSSEEITITYAYLGYATLR